MIKKSFPSCLTLSLNMLRKQSDVPSSGYLCCSKIMNRRSNSSSADGRLVRLLDKISKGNQHDSYLLSQCQQIHSELERHRTEMEELNAMGEAEADLRDLAMIEKEQAIEKINILQNRALDLLIPEDAAESSDIIIEVTAGIGGQEAMLFASELFTMYTAFAELSGWDVDATTNETTGLGGIRKASATISGTNIYKYLRYEGGIHRVQRVPKTESKGRIHTSTVGVIVLPQASELVVEIQSKDLKIETKRASGAGGQHVNTTDSAVRIVHLPTGLAVESQTQRSQIRNKEEAMRVLRARLYQMKLDSQLEKTSSARKLQVSSNSRSDKIRTYNFVQDRITDHRIGLTVRNIPEFMQGGYPLREMIETLVKEGRKEVVEEFYAKEGVS